MDELRLEWTESGQTNQLIITSQRPSKHPGTTRLGRDPSRCDVVFQDLSVSGLHAEIFFDSQHNLFFLRNLRPTNPPQLNGRPVVHGEVVLSQGGQIRLGKIELRITQVRLPSPQVQPVIQASPSPSPAPPPQSGPPISATPPIYGLVCPNVKCNNPNPQRIVAYERLHRNCPWCGTSLAAANSVLYFANDP